MPDQGSLIAGLRAKVAELESRARRVHSSLSLEAQVKALRAENKRLRELHSELVRLYSNRAPPLVSIDLHNWHAPFALDPVAANP